MANYIQIANIHPHSAGLSTKSTTVRASSGTPSHSLLLWLANMKGDIGDTVFVRMTM